MRFIVLRSNAVSRQICDKKHQPPLVNNMPTTRQGKIQNSMFRTPVDWFFFCFFFSPTFQGLKSWFQLSRVKLYRNDQRGNKNYFESAGGSSYRGQNYSKCMREIQGKSILVRVLARGTSKRGFELSGVNCICRQQNNKESI